MPNKPQNYSRHDGCFFCGGVDDPLLKSKTIYDITSAKGKVLAPHSVAICSGATCNAITRIDYREPQWKGRAF